MKNKPTPLIRLDINDDKGNWEDCVYYIGEDSVTQFGAIDYALATNQVHVLHDQEKSMIKEA